MTGANESLMRGRAVAESLDFPQGPWSAGYVHWLGSWMWMEAGRLDLADEALADLRVTSARHGFDNWVLIAATQTAVLEAIAPLRSGTSDAVVLAEHAEAISSFIEFWQALGLRLFLPFYLTTIGALLAAAGDVDRARLRYEESLQLAAETGMRFYDAETTRCLAHLAPGREAVVAELRAALDLARTQAARPFELRIALDLHDLLGNDANADLERAMRPFDDGATTTELEAARARVMAPR
jgi:hypothetical protein